MASTNKISFAVSVTPKVLIDEVDNTNAAIEVMHESVRRSVGGGGEITANSGDVTVEGGQWNEGVNTPATSNGTEYAVDVNTDMVFFKHTGILVAGGASAAADTVKITIHGDETSNVTGDGVEIAEIANGEAFLLPRPASTLTWKLVTGNSTNHVNVEVLILST